VLAAGDIVTVLARDNAGGGAPFALVVLNDNQ